MRDRAPKGRAASRLAWSLVGLTVLLLVGLIVIESLGPRGRDPLYVSAPALFIALAFPVIGALVASRHSTNPIGWIFCGAGVALAFSALSEAYGHHSLVARPGSLPGGAVVAMAGALAGILFFFPVATFLLLLFPSGRLPSSRWRTVAWLSACATAAVLLSTAFAPGRNQDMPWLVNPLGVRGPAGKVLDALGGLGWFLALACLVLSVLSLIGRLRRSKGEERQQLKWFVYAASLLAVSVIPIALAERYELTAVGITGLGVATGVAMLKYRLYEIDLIINRTLVYGALTAVLALVYLGGVFGAGGLLRAATGQESNDLVVAASTLAVAALFRPARSSIQAFIDRRFYRRKYDAARTLEAFSARLRDQVELEVLARDLVAVVEETMQPEYVAIWVRPPEGRLQRPGPGPSGHLRIS